MNQEDATVVLLQRMVAKMCRDRADEVSPLLSGRDALLELAQLIEDHAGVAGTLQ